MRLGDLVDVDADHGLAETARDLGDHVGVVEERGGLDDRLGAEGVFVGSGIFKSGNPAQRAEAIVKATTFFDDPDVIAKVSRGLGEAMVGLNVDEIPEPHRLAERGW